MTNDDVIMSHAYVIACVLDCASSCGRVCYSRFDVVRRSSRLHGRVSKKKKKKENKRNEFLCLLFSRYATAYHAVVQRGQMKAGETLLVTGAAGGMVSTKRKRTREQRGRKKQKEQEKEKDKSKTIEQ